MMFCPLGEGAAAGKGLRSAENVAANAAKLKNIKECIKVARTLTEAVGSPEARAIVNDVLKGNRPLSDLKPEQAKAAAEFFKEIAKSTKGKLSEAASKFNQLRADFLEGKTTEVPGALPDYIKRHGLPNQ